MRGGCSYTYMVVIPAAVAEKKYVDILKGGNPTVLPAWDPLVSASLWYQTGTVADCVP